MISKIVRAALVAAFVMVMSCTAMAAEKIGFIDAAVVLVSHPKYEETQKHLNDFVEQKEKEVRAAAENEKDPEKRRLLYDEARRASGEEEVRVMNPIMEQINAAIEKVAQEKSISVVLTKSLIFFGSEDLTDDVVKAVKAIK